MLTEEPVRDVDRVIHTEANSDHEVITGDGVNSDAPEVKEASDIHQSDQDNKDDDDRAPEIGDEYQRGEEDSNDGEYDVPVDFLRYHLVRLPGDVGARDGEGAAARLGNVGQVQTYLEMMGQT